MGTMTYNEGETHIIASYFQNFAPNFGPFYVGLGNGAAPMDERTTLSDIIIREISDIGYTRRPVLRDSSSFGWSIRGDTAWSPELEFTNTGTTCWEPVNFAFLTLSPYHYENPTTLIAASDFRKTHILNPGETLRIFFKFRQVSQYTNYQRIQCGLGDMRAYASIIPLPDGVMSLGEVLQATATIPLTVAEASYEEAIDLTAAAGIAGDGVVM